MATLRTPAALADLQQKYPEDRLLVLPLDVTKAGEITKAFDAAAARFGRVDVVFNNAGFAVQGEVEGTPDDVARKLFEVNFWGAANVTREAVRVFREVNKPQGGRLLQMSSISGVRSPPSMGYYGACKHGGYERSRHVWAQVRLCACMHSSRGTFGVRRARGSS